MTKRKLELKLDENERRERKKRNREEREKEKLYSYAIVNARIGICSVIYKSYHLVLDSMKIYDIL